jgi:hypothetical protein
MTVSPGSGLEGPTIDASKFKATSLLFTISNKLRSVQGLEALERQNR